MAGTRAREGPARALAYLARQSGIRRFAALVQTDNVASLGLAAGAGGRELRTSPGEVELVVELPPRRGIGPRVARALRAAATGSLMPAQTLVSRFADSVAGSPPS